MATRRRLAVPLLFLALPTVIVVLAVVVLMAVRISTKVRIILHANALWFEVGELAEDWVRLTDSASVGSLGVERFDEMIFEPARLEIGDWDQYDFETGRFAPDAWRLLSVENRRVTMTPGRPTIPATATIQAWERGHAATVRLDPLRVVSETSVSVEVTGDRNHAATIKLAGPGREQVYLEAFEPVRIETNYVRVAGLVAMPLNQQDSAVYRTQLREAEPRIEVTSQSGDLVLNLRFAREATPRVSFTDNVPLRAIRFSTVVEGKPKTTLVDGTTGEIRYLDYPGIGKVSFEAPDFIVLRPSEEGGFSIRTLTWDAESPGMQVELEGFVEHLQTGTRQPLPDHLLMAFDALWHSPRLMILFSIVLWVFPTSLGAYRLYKELTA